MIFQENYNWGHFLGEIIGGIIATSLAILTWHLIEKFKKYQKNKELSKNFNELYQLLSSKKYTETLSAEVINKLIYDINIQEIFHVIKMNGRPIKNGYIFEGAQSTLAAYTSQVNSDLLIKNTPGMGGGFSFKKPNENTEIFREFLNYFEAQCKKEGIKLDKNQNNE